MSIPLNSGRNPVDMIDAEEAIKWLAESNGKTIEEMKKILDEEIILAYREMIWQNSETLKSLCF